MYIQAAISKTHVNHKPKIYNRYTHRKRKRNPYTTLKIVNKSQEKITRGGKEKRPTKKIQNNQQNGNRNIHIDNYLKCKRIKFSTKRRRPAELIQKQDLIICCLQKTYFRSRDSYRLKVRGWKKVFPIYINGHIIQIENQYGNTGFK